MLNQDYGAATITHPFHPLYGQTFSILKVRRYPAGRHYSLQCENDVICVPESWVTPKTQPAYESPFDADVIKSLLDFIEIYDLGIDNS